jgi:hypothetical protein
MAAQKYPETWSDVAVTGGEEREGEKGPKTRRGPSALHQGYGIEPGPCIGKRSLFYST